jgi:7-cyano-7-deazaguanine synthase
MRKLLVILSGGMDSTIAAAWALQNAEEVHAITFNYGQRHSCEVEAAKKIAGILHLASHEVVDLEGVLKGSSPLVNPDEQVAHYANPEEMPEGVEPTFVPGRNLLFLTIAGNRAHALGASGLVMGVCQADYGGYHDCRQPFLDAAGAALGHGLHGDGSALPISAPLMNLTKAQTVQLAQSLPGAMEALAFSHTCYDGLYPPNPFNHASMLRGRGFHEAGVDRSTHRPREE